ncbi:hypothetical protein L1D15_00175 [Vibrio sp. Isolate25]|uniref:hypothetical protein n=1 Tax=Vibrio sp. Isolate25 TaxID=2908535 RepID=UPI001EFE8210|nr:hypothetical protein [Vibrio sp. Isolate25]MCG9595126.1 hypothetical protein [Vibrio sp. Isolate25]
MEQRLAEAEQPVKNFMADLLETLGKQAHSAKEPELYLRCFGAQLAIRLVSFEGDKTHSSMEE